MLSMASRVFATINLILFPPRGLLRTYLGYSFLQLLGYVTVALGHYLPSAATPLFYLGQSVFGFGRGIFVFPYLVLVQTFNQPSDAFAVQLWLALSMAGNNWGILLETIMEDTLKWSWYAALTVFSLINLLTAIFAFIAVP